MVGASIASTMLLTTLRDIQRAQDTSTLFAALGYARDAQPFGAGTTVVARWKGFKVVAIDAVVRLAGQLQASQPVRLVRLVSSNAIPRIIRRISPLPPYDAVYNALQAVALKHFLLHH